MAKYLNKLFNKSETAGAESVADLTEEQAALAEEEEADPKSDFPNLTLEDEAQPEPAGMGISEDGITLMACPENRLPAYIRASRVNTFSEVVLIDGKGVASCKTANGVTALLRRAFTIISLAPEHAHVNGY